MAEGLFRKCVETKDCFQVKSAGIAAATGSTASIETRNILLEHDVDFTSFRSQQLNNELMDVADYVFCMSKHHRQAILSHNPSYREKTLLVGEFLGEETAVDVFDPFGLGEPAYKDVEKQLVVAVKNIASFIEDNSSLQQDLK